MTMGIDTRTMRCELDENGGDIEIYYTIDIGNVILSKNSFVINIK